METVCRKIAVVRCGETEAGSLISGTLSYDGEKQMQIAGQKLKTLLKNDVTALLYPDGYRHVRQSANIIASALKVNGETLKSGCFPWDARNPAQGAKQLSEKAETIVLIGEIRDLQLFKWDFLHAGFRNISAHLGDKTQIEGAHIFGPGTFWCADLTKRTIFCGRARCGAL